MKPPKRGKLCAPGINRSRYRFGIGPDPCCRRASWPKEKNCVWNFETDFYPVKSSRLR